MTRDTIYLCAMTDAAFGAQLMQASCMNAARLTRCAREPGRPDSSSPETTESPSPVTPATTLLYWLLAFARRFAPTPRPPWE
jgi:hypothetical protein